MKAQYWKASPSVTRLPDGVSNGDIMNPDPCRAYKKNARQGRAFFRTRCLLQDRRLDAEGIGLADQEIQRGVQRCQRRGGREQVAAIGGLEAAGAPVAV